jgi:LPS export ABC transporter protein LptC
MRSIAFLLLLLIVVGCSSVGESGKKVADTKPLPDQEIWNGRIEISNRGLKQSLVRAGHIQLFEDRNVTLMDSGVIVDFYNNQGQHSSVLTSYRARLEEKHDFFLAEGNVVVTSDSGAVLRTERLYWDRENRKIRSDTLVTMTTQYDSLRGFEFDANEDLRSWQLKRPTGMTFRQIQK